MPTANLFSRLLARLSVGRKLMLIYLLDLTAVIYVSSILLNEKFIAIDFARKEIAGNAYVAEMRGGLIAAASLAVADAAGGHPAGRPAELAHTDAAHGAGMQSAEPSAALAAAYTRLAAAPPEQQAAALTDLLAHGRALITRVGNQSNLILDPDLDSYYTMSLIVLRYPELLEVVDAIGAQLAAQAIAGTAMAEARTQYLILEGKLDATRHGIDSDHSEAVAAGGAGLQAALGPAQMRLRSALEDYRRSARALIDGGATPQRLAATRAAQVALVHELNASWATAGDTLAGLLDARVASLYRRMGLHLGTALVLLCAILAAVYFVARQIAMPLRHLAAVTDAVRRTGDHSQRAEWRSSDEIGRLVVGFNDMLAQLDRERETQKELAASARAADAQRALVEATPIPLVVTSIPRHDVLHANPPAEAWLAGRRADPWQHGLEAAVRARFFQQLADRGAVDEFEVRWRTGTDAAWAVLSARRVSYQGQDAVLTAFMPINHLKLMERRLELWAKVFEASSEGILIVDAERRIVTANQAFSRLTGYELQEVVGEPPSLMLGSDGKGVPDPLWAIVAQRGTWQGERHVRRRNGSEYPAWLMVNAVRQAAGGVNAVRQAVGGASARGASHGEISHYIFTSIDISDRKKSEQRIRFLAEHDVLTELPNRSLCTERLRLAVQQAERTRQKVAVMFIDLDRFKDINDTLGHHIGDGLLRSVARRLLEAVRAGDTVSRLGGDEFVIVLNGVDHIDEVSHIVDQRLIPLIRQPHAVGGSELHVSCSVGIAIYPDDAIDIDELMRHADTAMYQAKAGGKDAAQFFTAEMTERALARMQLESHLRQALERKQLLLYWQPRIAAGSGALVGVEGLLRWQHPERGLVLPEHFVPLAEETGLIVPIGAWVVEEACRQTAAWRSQGLPAFGVSINLSARQLRDEGLIETVRDSLARHGIDRDVLEFELTESMVMDDAEHSLRQMHALRDLGLGVAIDDFGTGYSSLAYLNRFPIDKLKIDRSFVHHMLGDPTDRAITMAIIGLGHTLGLKVVAEGVEQPREAALLREARCDELQGFHFGHPMPAEALAGWLAEREPHPA